MIIEVISNGLVRSRRYCANSLNCQFLQKAGQLHVTNSKDGKPCRKAYVKVYAKSGGGKGRFFKVRRADRAHWGGLMPAFAVCMWGRGS